MPGRFTRGKRSIFWITPIRGTQMKDHTKKWSEFHSEWIVSRSSGLCKKYSILQMLMKLQHIVKRTGQTSANALLVCVVWTSIQSLFTDVSSRWKMGYSFLYHFAPWASPIPTPPLSNPLCLNAPWSFGKSLCFTDLPFIFSLVPS